jgi:glycosyltransferase involved in cell wall biosynthesis
MKITIIHGQFVEIGGAERCMLSIAEGLKKRGHEVLIETEFTEPYNKKHFLLTPLRFLRLVKKLKTCNGEVWLLSVHGAFISCPIIWATLLASRLKKIPTVAYVHEEAIRLDRFTPKILKLICLPIIAVDSFIFRILRPPVIIANSRLTAQNVENRYRVKVSKVIWPCFQF